MSGRRNSLRRWVLALSAALVGVGVAGASGPRELTLRKLTIVDEIGKPRIGAYTDSDGGAALSLSDRDGKWRIIASTTSAGDAALTFWDRAGKPRVHVGNESGGASSIAVFDSNGHVTWGQESK